MSKTHHTSNYYKWRSMAKRAGASKFEGDKDICEALLPSGQWVGSWDGIKGEVMR